MEKKLVQMIVDAQHNSDSMYLLIQKFHPLIQKYSRLLHYEDAEYDITAAFIEKIKGWNLLQMRNTDDYTLLKYINKIVKSLACNLHRKHSLSINNQTVSLNQLTEDCPFSSMDVTNDEYHFALYDLFNHLLTPRQNQIIQLIYLKNYSIKQVAAILNITEESIYITHKRALSKLRDYYEASI